MAGRRSATGWSLRRRQPLNTLTPALVILAFVTDYTELEIDSLWLLVVILLALLGLERFFANLERWNSRGIDYAEIIAANTLVLLALLTALLAAPTWVFPLVPARGIIENLRRKPAQSTAPQSLGLQEAPRLGPGVIYGRASLPRSRKITI